MALIKKISIVSQRLLCLLYLLWLVFHFFWRFHYLDDLNYAGFGLSDWLINYQGGFVRRGLAGQLLYYIYIIVPHPIRTSVIIILILSICALLWVTLRMFKNEGWSGIVLLAPFMIFPEFALFFWGIRRDAISLLLTYVIYKSYSAYIREGKYNYLFFFYLISILSLLIHEASFFYTFPILFLHFLKLFSKNGHISIVRYSVRTLLFMMPILITMFVVCLYKGNLGIADSIWASWNECFAQYPIGDSACNIGIGVRALTWDTFPTMMFHLKKNFFESVQSIPLTIFNFIIIYYLVTQINIVDLRFYALKNPKVIQLSNILLIQFIFMLPMFTVLSCDWARTLSYWVLSSLMAYHYFKDSDWSFKYISIISCYLQNHINKIRVLKTPWFYLLILLCLPIPFAYGATLDSSNLVKIIKDLEQFIYIIASIYDKLFTFA